jgi:hypothetical protein
MANELPEYKKQRSIESAPIVTGYREAYNSMSAVSTKIGEIGSQIAQNAANQMAAIKGQEAAEKNPSQTLLPAWTESDKHFKEAFEKEAVSNAAFSITQLIQKQQLLAIKNLNTTSLGLFDKNVNTGIDGITNNVPQHLRNSFKKAAQETYNSSYFDLAKAVAAKDRDELIGSSKVKINENLKNMYNYHMSGFSLEAEKTFNGIDSDIDNGQFTPEEKAAFKETNKNTFLLGKYNEKLTGIYNREGGENESGASEYIRHFNKSGHGLTQQEAEFVVSNMNNQLHTLMQTSSTNRILRLAKLQEDRINNITPPPTALPQIKKDLGQIEYTKFLNSLSKKNKTEEKKAITAQKIGKRLSENKNLLYFTGGEVKETFLNALETKEKETGKPTSFEDEMYMSEYFNDNRTGFKAQVEDNLYHGSPAQAEQAIKAIKRTEGNINSRHLDGVDNNAILVADLYETQLADETVLPSDALKFARDQVINVNPKIREERNNIFNSLTGRDGEDWNSIDGKSKHLRKIMDGWDKSSFSDGTLDEALNDFGKQLNKFFVLCGNMKVAEKRTKNILGKKYKVTYFNGKKQVMKHAPDGYIAPENMPAAENEFILDSITVFNAQKKAYDNKNPATLFYYRFAKDQIKPTDSGIDITKERLHKEGWMSFLSNKKIVEKIYTLPDGKEVVEKGSLQIDADELTKAPSMQITEQQPGKYSTKIELPSYPVVWISEKTGIKENVKNPFKLGDIFRFSTSVGTNQKENDDNASP